MGIELNLKTLGGYIRERRQIMGLTQRQVAVALGVHFTYISKIENDRLEVMPSIDLLTRIAGLLAEDAGFLLMLAGKDKEAELARLREENAALRQARDEAQADAAALRVGFLRASELYSEHHGDDPDDEDWVVELNAAFETLNNTTAGHDLLERLGQGGQTMNEVGIMSEGEFWLDHLYREIGFKVKKGTRLCMVILHPETLIEAEKILRAPNIEFAYRGSRSTVWIFGLQVHTDPSVKQEAFILLSVDDITLVKKSPD